MAVLNKFSRISIDAFSPLRVGTRPCQCCCLTRHTALPKLHMPGVIAARSTSWKSTGIFQACARFLPHACNSTCTSMGTTLADAMWLYCSHHVNGSQRPADPCLLCPGSLLQGCDFATAAKEPSSPHPHPLWHLDPAVRHQHTVPSIHKGRGRPGRSSDSCAAGAHAAAPCSGHRPRQPVEHFQ